MEENAYAEGEAILPTYLEKLNQRALPKIPLSENWLTISERVDIHYNAFFEALELLLDDSATFQMLSEISLDMAHSHLLPEPSAIQAEPSESQQPPTHTWDMIHEAPVQVGDLSPESPGRSPPPPANLASDTDPQIDFKILEDLQREHPGQENLETALEGRFSHERFNQAMSILNQYGPEEGLRRLKNDDPELALQIEKHLQNGQNKRR